jgi:cobalt-zinc-cadmium efflux system outer membrane protein
MSMSKSLWQRGIAAAHRMGAALLVAALTATLAAPVPAFGQEASGEGPRLTLGEAFRQFAEQSPELRAARALVAGAVGRLRLTSAYPNPSATVTYEPLFGNGGSGEGGSGGSPSEAYFNLHQELRWPGERSARIEAAERRVAATRARARADSLRGTYRVAELFVEAVAAERRAEAFREVVETFRTAEERGGERLALGDFSGYSLRRVRIERTRYESRLLRADLDAAEARRRLTRLLTPAGESTAALVQPVLNLEQRPSALARGQVVATALAGRAEIAAADAEQEAADAALNAARLAWRPDPTVTAGYKRQSDGLQGLFLGVSVPLPIYHQNEGQIEARQAELRAAEARRQLAERRVRSDVEAAVARYTALRERFGAVEENLLVEADAVLLGQADNLLDAARTSYAEGEMSLVELLDAATAYQEARLVTTDLLADLWTSYFRVLSAQGQSPLRMADPSFQTTNTNP